MSGSKQSDLVVLDRDALAALVSSCLDDQPATFGFHPLAKSMGLCPMPVIRLVCSLWHSLVSLKTSNANTAERSPSRNARIRICDNRVHSEWNRDYEQEQN